MKNLKFLFAFFIVFLFTIFLTACFGNVSETQTDGSTGYSTDSAQSESSTNNSTQESESSFQSIEKTTESVTEQNGIFQEVKDYILNGQDDKSNAEKLNWSETSLNQVNIDTVYQEYLSTGGKADDIENFAEYLTLNAPVHDNWKDLFVADFNRIYSEKIMRYKKLQDNLYQVYVEINGSEVPYVVVSSRTGYFHG